ncbi:MAG: hypothetical protein HZA78_03050, partial [Candidatus Schekmanbacteria bacterium]|nr:hypothetical protein [Candidatus Schekmanbacteria bacterium]
MRYEKAGFPTDNRQPITDNQISGKISQMFYSSPDFSSGVIKTKDHGTAKFAGKLMVNLNDRVTFGGSWKKHDKYGWQFQVNTLQHDLNLDAKGLAHYLKTNPAFKGIGPVKAERIATNFGEDFDRALQEEPEEIRRMAGLSKQDIETLQCEWQKRKEFNVLSSWLGKYELTHNQITRLIDKFGYSVKAILQSDPYILCREIDGFGFARTDQIARKMGIAKNLQGRIQAALLHVVAQRIDEGHCWAEEQELVQMASELLALDDLDFRERIEEQTDKLIADKRLIGHNTAERMLVADPLLYQREMDLAKIFADSLANLPEIASEDELTNSCYAILIKFDVSACSKPKQARGKFLSQTCQVQHNKCSPVALATHF